MNRLLKLQEELLKIISEQEGRVSQRDESLAWERLHMASSARCAWLLAMERGADPELAACAASVLSLIHISTSRTARPLP